MALKVFIPSGAGSPGFGGIAECLRLEKGLEIYAGDLQLRAYGKNLADGFCTMPPSDAPGYIDAVIQNALSFGCNSILPITTRELPELAAAQKVLQENGLAIAISPIASMEIANNKARTYDFLTQRHLPCVAFEVVQTKIALLAAVNTLGYPKNMVVMKPTSGNGSRGFRIVCSETHIRDIYFNSKAGTVFTTEAALRAELPEAFPFEMLVCAYLPGDEYSVDLLVDRGKIISLALRSREKTVSGISVRGTFLHDTEIESQCRILCENLDLHGPIGMQFKRDESGVAKLLEINPRLQGTVSTARFAGLNFPLMSVKLAMGLPFEIPEYSDGVSFNRYWKDIQE